MVIECADSMHWLIVVFEMHFVWISIWYAYCFSFSQMKLNSGHPMETTNFYYYYNTIIEIHSVRKLVLKSKQIQYDFGKIQP